MAKLVVKNDAEQRALYNRCSFLHTPIECTERNLCRTAKESVRWRKNFDTWGHDNCYWDWVYAITGSEKPVLQNRAYRLFDFFGGGGSVCPLSTQAMDEVQQWFNRRMAENPDTAALWDPNATYNGMEPFPQPYAVSYTHLTLATNREV